MSLKSISRIITDHPLVLALSGNFLMVTVRMAYTRDLYYGFLLWNLFLAGIPLIISSQLQRSKSNSGILFFTLLVIWMLFLPNAPYIITDLVHLRHRPPVPFWYDMLLVLFSAFNGMIMGFISMNQIERLLIKQKHLKSLEIIRIFFFLIVSYGVFLGRYLRYNSWDAFLTPARIMREVIQSLSLNTVAFTFTFAFVLYAIYRFYQIILLRRFPEAF